MVRWPARPAPPGPASRLARTVRPVVPGSGGRRCVVCVAWSAGTVRPVAPGSGGRHCVAWLARTAWPLGPRGLSAGLVCSACLTLPGSRRLACLARAARPTRHAPAAPVRNAQQAPAGAVRPRMTSTASPVRPAPPRPAAGCSQAGSRLGRPGPRTQGDDLRAAHRVCPRQLGPPGPARSALPARAGIGPPGPPCRARAARLRVSGPARPAGLSTLGLDRRGLGRSDTV